MQEKLHYCFGFYASNDLLRLSLKSKRDIMLERGGERGEGGTSSRQKILFHISHSFHSDACGSQILSYLHVMPCLLLVSSRVSIMVDMYSFFLAPTSDAEGCIMSVCCCGLCSQG